MYIKFKGAKAAFKIWLMLVTDPKTANFSCSELKDP